MPSSVLRVVVCSAAALVLASHGQGDEADAKKQLQKIGVHVVTLGSESGTTFTFTKSVDGHLKLLPEIKNLAYLGLGDTDVTDAGLKEVGRVKTLRQFWITAAFKITDAGVKELRGLENLEDLTLDRSKVTGTGFKDLKDLKKLRKLTLRGSSVTDAGLRYVAELPGVLILDLSTCTITDDGIQSLRAMSKLERLYLSGTGVTDKGLQLFQSTADFGTLKSLDVKGTKVTKEGVEQLRTARGKKAVNVTH
jgi:hypothetical protein